MTCLMNPRLFEVALTNACPRAETVNETPKKAKAETETRAAEMSTSPFVPPPPPLPGTGTVEPESEPEPEEDFNSTSLANPTLGPPGSIRFALLLDADGAVYSHSNGMDAKMASVTSGLAGLVWGQQQRGQNGLKHVVLAHDGGFLALAQIPDAFLLCMFADHEADVEFLKKRLLATAEALREPLGYLAANRN